MNRIGLLGAGGVAQAHARAISNFKNVRLTKVYDLNAGAINNLCSNYGGSAANSFDDLINESDLVIVATPNFTHFKLASQVIINGKSVLCEKPMANNLNEAMVMNDLSKLSGGNAYMGFNYRFLPIVNTIREMIDNDTLGNIATIKLSFKKNSALMRKNITWRDLSDSNGTSGAIGDLGVHLIDLIYYLFGEEVDLNSIKSIQKTIVNEKQNTAVAVDDDTYVCGKLLNSVFFEIETSKVETSDDLGLRIELRGDKATLVYSSKKATKYAMKYGVDWIEYDIEYERQIEDPEKEFWSWSDSFKLQLEEIFLNNGKRSASFGDGFRAQVILDRIIGSLKKENSEPQQAARDRLSLVAT